MPLAVILFPAVIFSNTFKLPPIPVSGVILKLPGEIVATLAPPTVTLIFPFATGILILLTPLAIRATFAVTLVSNAPFPINLSAVIFPIADIDPAAVMFVAAAMFPAALIVLLTNTLPALTFAPAVTLLPLIFPVVLNAVPMILFALILPVNEILPLPVNVFPKLAAPRVSWPITVADPVTDRF